MSFIVQVKKVTGEKRLRGLVSSNRVFMKIGNQEANPELTADL